MYLSLEPHLHMLAKMRGPARGIVPALGWTCLLWSVLFSVAHAAEVTNAPNRYVPYSEVTEIQGGMAWPDGQALPRFATPAATLDAIEVQSLSRDERITFSALQGLVNKKQPRILLLDSRTDEGRDTWAQTSTVSLGMLKTYNRDDKYSLVAKYFDEIRGAVLYDPGLSSHYRNLASTAAGLHEALPVTPAIHQRLRDEGVDLEVTVDLTDLTMSSPLEIYQYLHDHYWDRCEKRLILSARPDNRGGDHHHTRDMAAACGAAVVWLDGRIPAEREMLRKFFADMRTGNAVILGWHATERSGVTTASEFGIGTLPADHYLNSTVYSGTHPHIRIPPVPKKPLLENKVYVAIFISDGDNIQYMQRAMRRLWDRYASDRGNVPLNWTIAPGMVDIGPGLLNYYYTTATANDCFVTGPSGMGYMMPCNTLNEPGAPVGVFLKDSQRMDGYARLTETYLQRAGLRVVTIWDNATPEQRASYERHCRNLYGATVHNFKDDPSVASSVENQRVRFDKFKIPYVGSYEHIRRSLGRELRRWDGESPLFLSYQVAIWNEMKPNRIAELQSDLRQAYSEQVEFVRADHYFNLYNEANGLPYNLSMSPTTVVTASRSIADPEVVMDGTPQTLWTSDSEDAPWLEFDLGTSHEISRYVIRHAGSRGADRGLNTRDFTVHASADGTSWTPIDVQRENTACVTDVDLEPIRARYLKLTIDNPGADAVARIADVEIYGQAQ